MSWEEFKEFLFSKEYKIQEYEYYIYLNGEKIPVEYCENHFLGISTCHTNGKVYTNVTAEKELINEYTKTRGLSLFDTLIILLIVLGTPFIISKICEHLVYKEQKKEND